MWDNFKKNRFWISLLPLAAFILLTASFQFYLKRKISPKQIVNRVQNVLDSKTRLLNSYMNIVDSGFKNSGDVELLTKNELQSMDHAGLAVYVYLDDSLVYWSTNSFLAKNRLLPDQRDQKYPQIRKSANGWYYIFRKGNYQRLIEGRILIRHDYPFENEYLDNSFRSEYGIPDGTLLTTDRKDYPVYGKNHKYLFSLKIPEDPLPEKDNQFLLMILYIIVLVLFYHSFYHLIRSLTFIRNNILLFLIFSSGIVFIRFLQVYFRFPVELYQTEIFRPESFSSSFFFPSLGDFLVNALSFLAVAWVFYILFSGKISKTRRKNGNVLLILLFIGILTAEVFIAIYLLKDLVVNSTIQFNLQNISMLNRFSLIGFLIISTVFLALFFIGVRISGWMTSLLGLRNKRWIKGIRLKKYSVTNLVAYLAFFSFFATVTLNFFNEHVEKEKRKLLAIRLAAEREPLTEMMFARIEPELSGDSLLGSLLRQNLPSDSLKSYLMTNYFRDNWNNYTLQITNCNEDKILRVQPQNYLVSCDRYFGNLVREIGKPTMSRNFFFLDYGYGFKNYLAIISYKGEKGDSLKTYIEFSSKLIFKDLGYPELLVDKRQVKFPDITGYSYAFYHDKRLVSRVGNFRYSMNLAVYPVSHDGNFFTIDGVNHYFFNIDSKRTLMISRVENNFLDKISPFSYLFLLFGLVAIFFYLIISFPAVFTTTFFGLGARLQLTMSMLMVISLVIIGLLMMFYINRFNEQKNAENLSERAHSMLVELQHKMGNVDTLSVENKGQLEELLTKFSNVFFSDVNIYDTNGRLIGTSRPEIFDAGLLSRRMNGEAYRHMRQYHSSYFIVQEKVGKNTFSSAYMPFYNENNRLLAYLNLPYFTREEELKRDVSAFLIAFINIYVLLIIVGLIVSLFVSRFITRPLRLLTANIGRLGYGRKNEKLEWSRNDEVGKLVDEYNRMVNELEKSAGMLARSERESAWREMARQVAHEIKNPLTPMKLSVQHLQRAWKDKAPDWDERLHRFTDTMTEQIETLAAIASEFSDFAKMSVRSEEEIDIQELIDKIIVLYQDIASIRFVFNRALGPQYIRADRKQINRVFTNLVNNAIYAIGDKKEGIITISVVAEKDSILITLSDNGTGISREQAEHIFQPNFTTKSGGMGLGLAIVKSIVQGTDGEIHFHSEEGKGTTFMLRFPVIKV